MQQTEKLTRQFKPPLGIEPQFIWKEKRFLELKATIQRYLDANWPIPEAVLNEYQNIAQDIPIQAPKKAAKVENMCKCITATDKMGCNSIDCVHSRNGNKTLHNIKTRCGDCVTTHDRINCEQVCANKLVFLEHETSVERDMHLLAKGHTKHEGNWYGAKYVDHNSSEQDQSY